MTSRFPTPWRIVEMPTGFAVEDAIGLQLAVFYGRSDPNIAGHTGFLTIDEARQLALDFVTLPELLERTSVRSGLAKAKPQQPRVGKEAEWKSDPNAAGAPPNRPGAALRKSSRPFRGATPINETASSTR